MAAQLIEDLEALGATEVAKRDFGPTIRFIRIKVPLGAINDDLIDKAMDALGRAQERAIERKERDAES